MRGITFGDIVSAGLGPNVTARADPDRACVECGGQASVGFEAGRAHHISGWTDVVWCRAHAPRCRPSRFGAMVYRRASGDDMVVVSDERDAIIRREDGRFSFWRLGDGKLMAAEPWDEISVGTRAWLEGLCALLDEEEARDGG